jgi:hypothetical protein
MKPCPLEEKAKKTATKQASRNFIFIVRADWFGKIRIKHFKAESESTKNFHFIG